MKYTLEKVNWWKESFRIWAAISAVTEYIEVKEVREYIDTETYTNTQSGGGREREREREEEREKMLDVSLSLSLLLNYPSRCEHASHHHTSYTTDVSNYDQSCFLSGVWL